MKQLLVKFFVSHPFPKTVKDKLPVMIYGVKI